MSIVKHQYSDPTSLLQSAQNHFYSLILDSKTPTLILLSGGSNLSLLNSSLPKDNYSHLTVTTLDERFSIDPNINNFHQLSFTPFFQSLIAQKANSISTIPQQNENLSDFGHRINQEITNWIIQNPNSQIIATIGIGSDSHIAGIIPGTFSNDEFDKKFLIPNTYITDINFGPLQKFPQRITSTFPLLKLINNAIIYIIGGDKLQALKNTFNLDLNYYQTPSRLLNELPGTINIYTDISI